MSDLLQVADLERAKLHDTFHSEVVTGKVGGLAGGADINSSTNGVTGQVQATLPKLLSQVGFSPALFDFTTGGTLGSNDRNLAVFYETDGNWYSWGGALPKTIPTASSPVSTGGIAVNAWNISTSAFMYRDYLGFKDELYYQAGITDNGLPNQLGNSQIVDAINELIRKSHATVRLSDLTGIQNGDPTDNGLKVQQAMEYCATNNLHLVMDVTTYVDCTRVLQVTPTRQREGGILVPDHLRCTFLSKVEIRSLTNNSEGPNILVFAGRKDIKMFYPHVVGDRETHTGTKGEWGHGYEMAGAIGDILLFQPKARWTWGDGFYIGMDYSDPLTATPNNITLFEPRTYKASRNGISWTGGTDISIIRPVNEKVDRIAPMCGIDIEPEHRTISNMNVTGVIESPVSIECGHFGLFTFFNKGNIDIDITGTLVDRGSLRAWTHKVFLPYPSLTGALRINHIVSHNAKLEGILVENLKGHINVAAKTVGIYDCLSDTSSKPSIIKAAVGFETTFGASSPTVDAVFADVQIDTLNVYDGRSTKITEYPLRITRFHAQATYMENVKVHVLDNESIKGYIDASYGIRNSCNFRVTATFENPATWPAGVLASTVKIKSLSSALTLTLSTAACANGEGVRIEKLGGTRALTVKVPQDGQTLTNANVLVSGMVTTWAAASLEIAQIGTFSYGVVNNYGFAP